LVVGDDLLGGALEEEEDLEVASSGDVTQSASTVIVESEDWGLRVGIPEENTHEFFWVLGLNQSKWMDTISLQSAGTIIMRIALTVGPHSPGTLSKAELTGALSETIDSLAWKSEIKLNILIQHEEVSSF
jgi:hypothetical protein